MALTCLRNSLCTWGDDLPDSVLQVNLLELTTLLGRLGLNSSHYAEHSFQIGAATSAAVVGLPSWLIKTLGRWTSDCLRPIFPLQCQCSAKQHKNLEHQSSVLPNF